MSDNYVLPSPLIDAHNHLWDNDADKTLEQMDKDGIEMTLVMGLPVDTETGNKALVKACQEHPDRLVGGACYDPREGDDAIAKLKHYSAEGLRMAKLFPNLGYYPDDEALRPFFDTVAELGMGVLSHCGWLYPDPGMAWAAYYSHPGRFEKLIRIYPDTVFIMAHMGGITGFLETVMLTTRTPNTYTDCSPGQGLWVLETTGAIAASIPPDKLLWGADCHDPGEGIERYREAMVTLGFGEHLDAIFHDNARGIFEKIGAVEVSDES